MADANADALGAFLAARRAARSPREAGLPVSSRRRTAGLRREELAVLAGVSVQYLTRLEQGAQRDPSPSVLAALADALGLAADARRHLFALAGRVETNGRGLLETHVGPSLERMVERSGPSPAVVLNRRRDLLAHNRAAQELFASLGEATSTPPNYLRMLFCAPAARRLWVEWQVAAEDAVAHLREVAGDDPAVVQLVRELRAASLEFAALWERQDVRCSCASGTVIDHPQAGPISFRIQMLAANHGDLELVVFDPATPAAQTRWATHIAANAAGALRAV